MAADIEEDNNQVIYDDDKSFIKPNAKNDNYDEENVRRRFTKNMFPSLVFNSSLNKNSTINIDNIQEIFNNSGELKNNVDDDFKCNSESDEEINNRIEIEEDKNEIIYQENETQQELVLPDLWDINEAEQIIKLRRDITAIVEDHTGGKDHCLQSQFVKINFECRKLDYNFDKPAILSWMLLDLINDGKVDNNDIVEWLVNNTLVESDILLILSDHYSCKPNQQQLNQFVTEGISLIILQREELFMQYLFVSMDMNDNKKVYRIDFENWFMVKMPGVNNHDRMKILGMLCKEFKSKDSIKKGQLEWTQFVCMKDYIINWFIIFNQYMLMDESGNGQIKENQFIKHKSEIKLPDIQSQSGCDDKKIFKMLLPKDKEYITLAHWFNLQLNNKNSDEKTQI